MKLLLKQNKTKIIVAAVILAVLAGAWFYGGNYSKSDGNEQTLSTSQDVEQTTPGTAQQSIGQSPFGIATQEPGQTPSDTAIQVPEQTPSSVIADTVTTHAAGTSSTDAQTSETDVATAPTVGETTAPVDTHTEEIQTQQPSINPSGLPSTPDGPIPDSIATSTPNEPTTATNPETGMDQQQTSPAPEGNPPPVEPEDAAIGDGSFTVTLTVRCDTILGNMTLLNKEKWELVPEDGIIFQKAKVTAHEGESVFNVLSREMKRAKIHLAFRNTPIFNSAFIEAINNLYEFDTGELSGWMYSVNGWYPNYGCSRYQLSPGDEIEWRYTCNMGRDLGQPEISGWQY